METDWDNAAQFTVEDTANLIAEYRTLEVWADWAWNFIADMRGLRKFGDHDPLALELLKQHPKHGE